LEATVFSTGTVKKSTARPLETQDHCAVELFAPELIHESWNCSNVHSLPPDSSRRETLLVQHDIEQRPVHFQPTVIVNEARNRFIIMKLIRVRALPIISANVSWPIFGPTFSPISLSFQSGPAIKGSGPTASQQTFLNVIKHLRDPARVQKRLSEGNDPQLSNAIEWDNDGPNQCGRTGTRVFIF
jgi:hypothetical protein